MLTLYIVLFVSIVVSFFLSISRFLQCLIILENFNVLLLLFCLLLSVLDSHIIFIILMVVSTIEVVVGLVVLTRVWECASTLELASF